jgi:hypothetical protein
MTFVVPMLAYRDHPLLIIDDVEGMPLSARLTSTMPPTTRIDARMDGHRRGKGRGIVDDPTSLHIVIIEVVVMASSIAVLPGFLFADWVKAKRCVRAARKDIEQTQRDRADALKRPPGAAQD